MEIIDIFDENGNKIGEKEKNQAHIDHDWHNVCHVWIVNGNDILIQKRSKNKKSFPNIWDIAVAGHFQAGETPLDASKREMKEEIGITFLDDSISFKKFKVGSPNGYIVNEFQYVVVVSKDVDASKLKLDPLEVDDVKWVSKDELLIMYRNKDFFQYKYEYLDYVFSCMNKINSKEYAK